MHLKPFGVSSLRSELVPIDSVAEEAAAFLAIKIANHCSGIAVVVVWLAVLAKRTEHVAVADADDAMGTCTEMVCMNDSYNLAEESETAGKCRT